MNKYELALVVSAKLDDAAREAVVEKAKGYVTRYGGEISEVEEWGKKRLAYEIQHERDGYYFFVEFEAEPTAPAEIERHVRIMDSVLRYLIVRRDEDGAEMADNQPAPEAENEEAAPAEEAKEEN
jgi:small subunit ribosomal protein S6